MTPAQARKKLAKRKKLAAFDPLALAFPAQLPLLTSTERFRIACNSRRSGKSTAAALALIDAALKHPGTVSLFIAFTWGDAKEILWDLLLGLNLEHGLGAKDQVSRLELKFPNGSVIRLRGASTQKEIGKVRGRKYALVVIDEAQLFGPWLRSLVDDVLVPALIDLNGSLILLGTPPPSIVGYFVESLSSNEFHRYSWTIFDNPHIRGPKGETPRELLDQELKRRHVKETDPTIQREWWGLLVEDPEALAVKWDTTLNNYTVLPPWTSTTFGVDIGWNDSSCISVMSWDDEDATAYLAEELIGPKMTAQDLAGALKRLGAKYNPTKVFIDTSGNRQTFESIRQELWRHGVSLPLEPRPVLPVVDQIGIINSALQIGRLKVKSTSRFAQDSRLVTWQDGKVGKLAKSPHSDAIPALIYALQAATPLLPNFAEPPSDEPPEDINVTRRRARQAYRERAQYEVDAADLGFGGDDGFDFGD
jgi:hypothetical protein